MNSSTLLLRDFVMARKRAEALLRLKNREDNPQEYPSDLPYIMAREYLALWSAYEKAYEDGYQAGLDDERL